MFKSMIVAMAMLLSMHAVAQNFSIGGSVKNGKSNQVLAGATVQVENQKRYAITDEFGRFRIEKLPAGDYSLLIRFIGFVEKTVAVSLAHDEQLTITLDESVQLTDEVVVHATRANEKTPTTFTNVSGQVLNKQNFGQDMPMLLNWTP